MAGKHKTPKAPKPTSVLLTEQDLGAIRVILDSGWARNTSGAIGFALKYASEHAVKEAVA